MKLLVSVRNVLEARIVIEGGADILDIKEPLHGALGAAASATIQAIAEVCGPEIPLSVACGELAGANDFCYERLPAQVRYAKVGLGHMGRTHNWVGQLKRTWARLPSSTAPVVVAYADWQQAGAPHPLEVIENLGNAADIFLLDTVTKTTSLVDQCSSLEVRNWLDAARRYDLRIVLAGSLQGKDIPYVAANWSPDVLAVRGAACKGRRSSQICQEKVRLLKTELCQLAR